MRRSNLPDEYRFQEVDELLDGLHDMNQGMARDMEDAIMAHYVPKPHDEDGVPIGVGAWVAVGDHPPRYVSGVGQSVNGPMLSIGSETYNWYSHLDGTRVVQDPKVEFLERFAAEYNAAEDAGEVVERFAEMGKGVF